MADAGTQNGANKGTTTVVGVSCGSSHTVALVTCADGSNVVASWGRGEDGQLGHGDANESVAPKAIHALIGKEVSSICCGAEYTVAVSRNQQQVYSWGWGDFGRLGHGDCTDVFMPQQIAFFSGVSVGQVACGDTHTLVVTDSGELFSFGRNQNGQLGLGNTNDALAPQEVESLKGKNISSIACGAEHTVVATQEGQVYAWGWGRYGNIGDGERQDRHLPAQVHMPCGARATHVACGWRHSAAVTDAGRVFTFGWSKYGQLGHGDHSDRLVPAEVAALSHVRVTCVAGGWRHTSAVDEAGRIYAWGWNKFGQLGLGDTADRPAPTEVAGLCGHRVARLSCGWRHTVAVTDAGEVYSWGRGVNGQLGHGDEADVSTPKRLAALCRGTLNAEALVATASAPGGYVAPADRYAVVPDGDAPMVAEVSGGGGGAVPAAKKQRLEGAGGVDAAVPDGG